MNSSLRTGVAADCQAAPDAWVVSCVLDRPAMLASCGTALAAVHSSAEGIEVLLDGELFDVDALASQWNLPPGVASNPSAVALEAFRRHGTACAEVLNGRFALLIADRRTRRLIAIRDRIGFHPLFYVLGPNGVLLSPSIPALLAQPGVTGALDPVVLAEHLMNRWIDIHETYFTAVRRVPPGRVLTITSDGHTSRRYWNPGERPWLDESDVADFERVFDRAVSRCLAPGRTGIFLSGGFDSVSVGTMAVDLARRRGLTPPHALSLGFPHPESNEEFTQRSVAQSLGMSQDLIDYDEAVSSHGGAVRAAMHVGAGWPQPLLNFWYPAYRHLARLGVAHGCTAILTGTGGDEWLNVTPFLAADLLRQGRLRELTHLIASHQRSFKYTKLETLWALLWRFGARPVLGSSLENAMPRWSGARRNRNLSATPPWVAPDPEIRRRMSERAWALPTPTRPPDGMGFYKWQMEMALEHPLVTMEYEEHFELGQRLWVQLRHPYLDPDLVELLYRTPPAFLLKGGRTKAMVRETLARRFPNLGFDRARKMDATSFFRDTILREGPAAWQSIGRASALPKLGVVSEADLKTELRELSANKRPLEIYRIWQVLNLETWARAHA